MQNQILKNESLILIQQILKIGYPKDSFAPDGVQATYCPNAYVFYHHCDRVSEPGIYEPGLVFLISGKKEVSIGANSYCYDSSKGFCLTGSHPVLCTSIASKPEPLVGIYIALVRDEVFQLIAEVNRLKTFTKPLENKVKHRASNGSDVKLTGATLFAVDSSVQQAVFQLLTVLTDPLAAQLFGQERIKALLYRLLSQTHIRKTFVRWIEQDGSYAQFLKAIYFIKEHLSQPHSVNQIASHAGMSISSLNRVFKHFASETPLQYIKKLRLNQAYLLLKNTRCSVQVAAYRVGYESASQFSREFKRNFGLCPNAVMKQKN